MPLNTLTPLPFLPIPGKFDLNTFLPGSSDYEILARVVETYNSAVKECYNEVQKLINGEYIETYVQALATWIDNNLQVMVSKIVKYVWFEINEDGYFIAWIPDTWDFIDFDTEMNPDSEDYGKLALLWEPEVVQ